MGNRLRQSALAALSALLMLAVGLHLGGFQLAAAFAAAEFGLDKTGMGLLVAVQCSSIILAPALSGRLADRFGKKPLLMAAVLSMPAGCLTAGLSRRLAPFAAGIFLVGCGGSVTESVTAAAIADRYPDRSSRLINLCQFFFSAGAIAGPVLVQGCLDRGWSWRPLYGLVGGVFLLLSPAAARLRLAKVPAAPRPGGGKGGFFAAPAFRLLFAGILLYVGLENGFGYFAGSLFAQGLDAPARGALAVSIFWAGTALSRLVNSALALPPARLAAFHYLAAAAGLLAMALCRSAVVGLAVSFAVGFSYGPIWSALMALAAAEFPSRSAGAVGLMSTGCGIGGAVYPVLMGAMADRLDIRAPFLLLAATALAGALLAFGYLRRRRP